jgi:hypothetical protein
LKKTRVPSLIGLLICFFLLTFNFRVSGQTTSMWNQTYGGPETEDCFTAIETSDRGYAMVGRTYSFGAGDADIWLVKTDSYGNLEWNKTFGTQGHEEANHLTSTDDKGFIIVGTITPLGFDYRDVWLIKTDSFGYIQWNKTYSGNGDDKP